MTRKLLQNHAPQKVLDRRTQALHVDRLRHYPGWNRPCRAVEEDDANYYLGGAMVRYAQLRLDLRRDYVGIGKVIWARIQQLQLPEARWDIWNWKKKRAG
jgi:hypothetical protein